MIKFLIHNVISMEIGIEEIEEVQFSSFRIKLELSLFAFSRELAYRADDFWFSPEEWDQFSANLRSLGDEVRVAELTDLGNEFVLTLALREAETECDLSVTIAKNHASQRYGNQLFAKQKSTLSRDELAILQNAFEGFAKWW